MSTFCCAYARYVPFGGLQLLGHHIPTAFKVRDRTYFLYHKIANVGQGRYECNGHTI